MSNLDKKIERAISILRMPRCEEMELSYSGGKDSDVILELAKMAGVNFRPIYKNTTIDPPHTIQHCKENGVFIQRPKMSFFELIRKKGFPTRRARFCCDVLKEYKILDTAIQGIRRCESLRRTKLYSEEDPIICRTYGKKENHVNVVLPILDWTNDDVAAFVEKRNIKLHPIYYEDGQLNVNRRLGCIGCPLASDKGLSDFKKYPNMVKLWIKAGDEYLRTHPNVKAHEMFGCAADLFVHNLFYNSYEEYKLAKTGMFGAVDSKSFLEDYFQIEL